MLNLQQRIAAFVALGQYLNSEPWQTWESTFRKAEIDNAFFTAEFSKLALKGIAQMLSADDLKQIALRYPILEQVAQKKIGVVMAGNVPAVGFHDFASVLLAGHTLLAKPSSQDSVLIKRLAEELVRLEPGFTNSIQWVEKLNDADAYIATGSDSTAMQFRYYFGKKPNLIRGNRTSVLVLHGWETADDLQPAMADMFQYFGLGCRSVGKVYMPEEYAAETLCDAISTQNWLLAHHKYMNNYNYHKAIALMNLDPFLDTGFVMVRELEQLHAPLGQILVERYTNLSVLQNQLNSMSEKLQVITSVKGWYEGSLPSGTAQQPGYFDYADKADTLEFLSSIM